MLTIGAIGIATSLLIAISVLPASAIAGSPQGSDDYTVEPFTPFDLVDPNSLEIEFSKTELAFHAQLASDRGISAADGTAEQELILQLSAVATQIDVKFPGLLMQSEWRHDAVPNAQLVLHSPVPEEAFAVIEAAPIEIAVVEFDGPSTDESNAVAEQIVGLLRKANVAGEIAGGFDLATRTYSVSYSGGELDKSTAAEILKIAGVMK